MAKQERLLKTDTNQCPNPKCAGAHFFVDRSLLNIRYRCLRCQHEWVEPALRECSLCHSTVPTGEIDEQGRCEVCRMLLEKVKEEV